MKYLLILALVACGSAKPKLPPPPLRVEIVKPIPREAEFCWGVADWPNPPDELEYDFEEEDIFYRTTVPMREYNKLLAWARDVGLWAHSVRECLNELTERP